jgi:hypothetical protein
MTTKELIEELSRHPENTEVQVDGGPNEWSVYTLEKKNLFAFNSMGKSYIRIEKKR